MSLPQGVFRFIFAVLVAWVVNGAADTVLPPGFVEKEVVAPGDLAYPTAMVFAPDGRLFVGEQGGFVRIIKNGVLLPQPFLSVNAQFFQERGLVGLTLDPNFAENHYVYVYYTAPTPVPHNRVSRFTANGDLAVPGSELVVLDLPALGDAGLHNSGGLNFGPDKKLYVSVGDNLRSTNSASLLTPLGKILRVNADGSVPNDNPFFNVTSGINRTIWAMGLRNPFTFTFQRTTGRMFINDVGNGLWEEINEGVAGANYGWPRWEGASPASDKTYTNPLHTYPHPATPPTSASITGGAFYNPPTNQFPAQYLGKYFFLDGTRQWIKVLDPVSLQVSEFAPTMNSTLGTMPLYLTVGPEGSLYYVGHFSQAIYKIEYTGAISPQIGSQPVSQTVSAGDSFTLNVSAYGAAPVLFQWQRRNAGAAGFADIAGATDAAYTLAAGAADDQAQFRVLISNAAGSTNSQAALLTVSTVTPPVPQILAPTEMTYRGGDTITLVGRGIGSDGSELPASALSWAVIFHHQDHTHPFVPEVRGVATTTVTIPFVGESSPEVFYRIHLTVTDPNGLARTATRDLLPDTALITLQTDPPGLQVALDGGPFTTPKTFTGVAGIMRALSAKPQVVGGTTYEFGGWSDGGAATHTIATPGADTTYTAVFRPVSNPTDGAAFDSQYFLSFMAAGQTYEAALTFVNNGTTAWSPDGGYFLGSVNPDNNTVWGLNRVTLPGPVLPGESVTLRFDVTAPDAAGTYTMQWRMIREGGGFFGEASPGVPVVVGVVPFAAAFVSQDVPTVVNASQRYSVSVRLKNVGTNVWTEDQRFRLGSYNPRDNSNWGVNRGLLPNSVAPGQVATFTFNITAPDSPGVYHFQWRAVQDGFKGAGFFGDVTPDVAIEVRPTGNASVFLSQSVPTVMQPGQRYPVTIQMRNLGTTTWTVEAKHRLASVNPVDNQVWGQARVVLPGPVAPGEVATFNFTVTAPAQPGAYNFQWRMVQDGVSYFGASSPNISVAVGTGSDDAAFVSQIVPTSMAAGRTYPVTITLRNAGTLAWAAGGNYTLSSQNPAGNLTWGIGQVALPVDVAAGQTVTLNFNVQAPVATGPYTMQWQMNRAGSGYLGQATTPVNVNVFAPYDDAVFLAQSVPAAMSAGGVYPVSITMSNSGTTTWATSPVITETIALGYKPLPTSQLWGLNRVVLPGPVPPGATVTFNFSVQAPATPGNYDFQWQVVKGPVGFFGGLSPLLSVAVTGGTPVDDAVFVSQTLPPALEVGRSYPTTVVLRNAGTTTWLAGAYALGSQGPADNLTWGANRVALTANVAPGQNATFAFDLRAPAAAGTYVSQWQMVRPAAGFFGMATPPFPLPVTPAMNVATVLAQSVPATMDGGRSYNVSVAMRNAGATTWDPVAGYQLGALSPAGNTNWGLASVPLSNAVPPGGDVTFNFRVTAPIAAGAYDFQWGMSAGDSGPFGQATTRAVITVTAVGNGAAFVSQTVPASMGTGGVYPISVTLQNVGTNRWTPENLYRLASINPVDNLTFAANRVLLPGPVEPGQLVTFNFNAHAPPTPGSYNFQWRMLREGVSQFGDATPNVAVNVVNAPAADAAVFVSQSVPATMVAGQPYSVAITYNNAGSAAWSRERLFRLGSQSPQDNFTWNLARVLLPNPVPPGENVTFTFTVLAPQTAGLHNFGWRMVHEGFGWFGDFSPPLSISVVPAGGPVNGSSFVSQAVPATLTAGQAANVSLVFRNTGTAAWTSANNYRLASQNPADNATWGPSRIDLPASVAPGGTLTLNFPITAPATAGNYNFQWQLIQEGTGRFGDVSPNVSVAVTPVGPPPVNGSAYVSQSVPLTMNTGETRAITVTLRNSGTTTWSTAGGYHLASQNPANNSTWLLNSVVLPASVAPGTSVTFSFNITAPTAAGSYNMQWQMAQNGVGLFGDASPNIPMIVTAPPVNAATFVSQSVPASLTPGQSSAVTITLRNSGSTTWTTAANYRLASQNPADNNTWGFNRVALPASVAPGGTVTFSFNVTAPTAAGTYNSQWRLIQDGVGLFGDATPNVSVTVVAAAVNAAVFVTQSVATAMTTGQTSTVTVTMRNSGTTTWTTSGNYRLASQNPADNTTWAINRVALPAAVAPGASVTFSFAAKAPATAGNYSFQWRMIQDGVGLFGDSSLNTVIVVTAPNTGTANNAVFVSQNAPTTLKKGGSFFMTIKMKNTGTVTWLANGTYKLGSQNPVDNTTWGLSRASLGVQTAPNGTASFTFLARAPATAGTYNLQWQMTQDGVGFFGDKSTNVAVVVTD